MADETLNINSIDATWAGASGAATDIDETIAGADAAVYGPGPDADAADFGLSATVVVDADTVTQVDITVRLEDNGTAGTLTADIELLIGGTSQGLVNTGATGAMANYGPLNTAGWNSDWTAAQLAGAQIRITPQQSGMPGTNALDIDCADVLITYTADLPTQSLDNMTGIASVTAFGTDYTINNGTAELDLDGGGIASTTAFGTDYTLNAGTVFLDLDTAGIASTTAFGSNGIQPEFLATDITFYGSGASNIGGAIAAIITSGDLNNLWDDVSSGDASAGDIEYRCVYVRNDHPAQAVANVFVNINTDPAESDITIGLGAAGLNGSETAVADEDTAPGGVSFATSDVSIGSLSATDSSFRRP